MDVIPPDNPPYYAMPKEITKDVIRKQRHERTKRLNEIPISEFPFITKRPESFPKRSPNRHGLSPRGINRLKGSIKHERIPFPISTPKPVHYSTTRFYDRKDQV